MTQSFLLLKVFLFLLVEQCEYGDAPLFEHKQGTLQKDRLFVEKDVVVSICINIDAPGKACAQGRKPDLDGLPVGVDGHIDDIVSRRSLCASCIEDTQDFVGTADDMVIRVGAAGNDIGQAAGGRSQRSGNDRMLFAECDDIFIKTIEKLCIMDYLLYICSDKSFC